MSANGTRTIIWLGGESQFCIAKVGLILDLEEKCKAGIAAIMQRLLDGSWRLNDVRETIRLGLIGGGMSPEQAMEAVRANVDEHPLGSNVMVALHVLEAAIVGVPGDPVGSKKKTVTPAADSSTTTGA